MAPPPMQKKHVCRAEADSRRLWALLLSPCVYFHLPLMLRQSGSIASFSSTAGVGLFDRQWAFLIRAWLASRFYSNPASGSRARRPNPHPPAASTRRTSATCVCNRLQFFVDIGAQSVQRHFLPDPLVGVRAARMRALPASAGVRASFRRSLRPPLDRGPAVRAGGPWISAAIWADSIRNAQRRIVRSAGHLRVPCLLQRVEPPRPSAAASPGAASPHRPPACRPTPGQDRTSVTVGGSASGKAWTAVPGAPALPSAR